MTERRHAMYYQRRQWGKACRRDHIASLRPDNDTLLSLYGSTTAQSIADGLGLSVWTVRSWISRACSERARQVARDDLAAFARRWLA